VPNNHSEGGHADAGQGEDAEPTTAFKSIRSEDESDPSTEKMNARGDNGDPARQRRRSGGGLSAADLLRREGRL
jgi:trehalose monomycolate/heme transporter